MRGIINFFLIVIVLVVLIIVRNHYAYRDIGFVKDFAPRYLEKGGFKNITYRGYTGDIVYGGFCWYIAEDKDGYLYEIQVGEWRDELTLISIDGLNSMKIKNE